MKKTHDWRCYLLDNLKNNRLEFANLPTVGGKLKGANMPSQAISLLLIR